MKVIVAVLFMSIISGCGVSRHLGNENLKPEMVSEIQKGKTTKQELLSIFGPPQSTTKQNLPTSSTADPNVKLPVQLTAAETWNYWSHITEGTAVVLPFYAQTNTKSSNFILTIYLDNQGTVIDYQTMQNNY
jgi:hypothetical protein